MESFVTVTGTGLRYAGYALAPLLLLPILVLIAPKPLENVASFFKRILDRISGLAMGFAVTAAFLIILIQLAAVLLRYVFGLSFSWLNDSVIFSFAMIFKRLIMAAWKRLISGGTGCSCRIPSIR